MSKQITKNYAASTFILKTVVCVCVCVRMCVCVCTHSDSYLWIHFYLTPFTLRWSTQTIMKDISDTSNQVTKCNRTLDLQHSGFASAVPACVKYVLYPSFLLLQLNPARCATVRCGRRRTKVLMP